MTSREGTQDKRREQTNIDPGNGRRSPPRPQSVRSDLSRKNEFAPDDGRYVTLEEYWANWYENPYPDIDVSYEWNNGRLEAKPLPNKPQLNLYNWFLDLLRRYLETPRDRRPDQSGDRLCPDHFRPHRTVRSAGRGAKARHRRDPA